MGLDTTQPLNRNEYQESSCGVKSGRCVSFTTLPLSVSRLSRENVGVSISHNPMGLNGLLQEQFCLFFYDKFLTVLKYLL
jgi:hypothetical protein